MGLALLGARIVMGTKRFKRQTATSENNSLIIAVPATGETQKARGCRKSGISRRQRQMVACGTLFREGESGHTKTKVKSSCPRVGLQRRRRTLPSARLIVEKENATGEWLPKVKFRHMVWPEKVLVISTFPFRSGQSYPNTIRRRPPRARGLCNHQPKDVDEAPLPRG